jgi:uncharacterized membrane protein YdjX (TVP38/TMEM64 family)
MKKFIAACKFSVLVLLLVGIPLVVWLCFPQLVDYLRDPAKLETLLAEYKVQSAFLYIGLQIIQIVLCFLPGQLMQIAAGYAFSVPGAWLLSLVGIGLGTCVTIVLARVLGTDMLLVFFGEERIKRFTRMMNSKKAFVIIFLLYLFPGVPKDFLSYVAGVTRFRMLPFVLLSLTARSPALLASLIFGNMFRNGNFTGMVIVGAIVLVAAAVCLLFRKRFLTFVDRIYQRTSGGQ